ncbi:DUF6233 domain-containing protein [Streptomyces sp. 7N604]|uniref:DUF6233 domain-containing protein n=1 Tax=Streptomyces sp. 7N604 TaxID=3457415 RepID=UPI003FD271E9
MKPSRGDEIPEVAPTPPVRIVLPDRQELTGRLLGRWQAPSGEWVYKVSISVWSYGPSESGYGAQPFDDRFDVPASKVRPVDGVSYDGVPTGRHPAAVARAQARSRGTAADHVVPGVRRATDEDRWALQPVKIRYDSTAPRPTVIHHALCFLYTGEATLTTAEARQALARPGTRACDACHVEERLKA